MRDGVRIAVDLWLPAGLSAQQKIPALMVSTRYWRAQDIVPRIVGGVTCMQGLLDDLLAHARYANPTEHGEGRLGALLLNAHVSE